MAASLEGMALCLEGITILEGYLDVQIGRAVVVIYPMQGRKQRGGTIPVHHLCHTLHCAA